MTSSAIFLTSLFSGIMSFVSDMRAPLLFAFSPWRGVTEAIGGSF